MLRNPETYQRVLSRRRERDRREAARLGIAGSTKRYAYDAEAIIRAVDNGGKYRDVAKRFKVTVNVVAGVMSRRSEANGVAA